MNLKEPNGEAQAHTAEVVMDEGEQVTGEFPIDPALLDAVVVDDVRGRTSDALVSVKRRIRAAVNSAGQS
jgi:hypothetical protein